MVSLYDNIMHIWDTNFEKHTTNEMFMNIQRNFRFGLLCFVAICMTIFVLRFCCTQTSSTVKVLSTKNINRNLCGIIENCKSFVISDAKLQRCTCTAEVNPFYEDPLSYHISMVWLTATFSASQYLKRKYDWNRWDNAKTIT